MSWDEVNRVSEQADPCGVPFGLGQEIVLQTKQWGREWGIGNEMCKHELPWPDDTGKLPEKMEVHDLFEVLNTFPDNLGLGWDRLHPKALLRLPGCILRALLRIMFLCEVNGE